MLIFDGFPTEQDARRFVAYVKARYRLDTQVYLDARIAQSVDPIPVDLTAPVVHVDRTDFDTETKIAAEVEAFGGEFAGT